ncbi:PIN domain-like protein [Favolaschia claudopus]|uniref:PIN domain-like protein n=1 Tax=Favolaschia claudopus TaxID=2862362 RepID=A0AAW0E7K9_9AGAR
MRSVAQCSKGLTGEDNSAFYGRPKKLARMTAVMGYKAGMTHVVGNLARPGPRSLGAHTWYLLLRRSERLKSDLGRSNKLPIVRSQESPITIHVQFIAVCTVLSRHSSKAAFLGVLKLAGLTSETGDACSSLPTMGIPDYWKTVKPASEVISLKQLAADEGLSEKRRELGSLRVGVDLCLLITQSQAVFHKLHHAQFGRNPELRAVFYKAAAILAAGVDGLFVVDGGARPTVKRNKRVKAKPHWLIEEVEEMLKLFGFHLHKAPGEAEAELAYLNRIGEIDAVLTDDGDAALFGATCILRNLDKNNKDNVTMYTSTALASHPDVQLTQGGIFLLDVLRGRDYDTPLRQTGLPNCGMSIAHGLAHCGFGDSLLAATQTMSDTKLQQFLVSWRAGALAARLPDTFPNIKTLKLYAHPITSWSDGYIPPNTNHWRVRLPSLPELALFVHKKFGWKPTAIGYAFGGPFLQPFDLNRQLHQHVNLGRVDDEYPQMSSFLGIVARQEVRPGVTTYQMKIAVNVLTRQVLSRLRAPTSAAGSSAASITQWFSSQSVERYFPVLVQRFNNNHNVPRRPPPRALPTVIATQVRGLHLGFVDLTLDDEADVNGNNENGEDGRGREGLLWMLMLST